MHNHDFQFVPHHDHCIDQQTKSTPSIKEANLRKDRLTRMIVGINLSLGMGFPEDTRRNSMRRNSLNCGVTTRRENRWDFHVDRDPQLCLLSDCSLRRFSSNFLSEERLKFNRSRNF